MRDPADAASSSPAPAPAPSPPDWLAQQRNQVQAALLARLRTELAHRLADCPAVEVRLFGSWERADFDGHSDVDLALIGAPDQLPAAEAALADLAVTLDRDVDVQAVTPADYAHRIAQQQPLWCAIERDGVVVHHG